MISKAIRAGFRLFAVTVFVTVSASVTEAQMTCNQAYRELRIKSVYRETFLPLREFERALTRFGSIELRDVTAAEVQAKMAEVQSAVESYFTAAGIHFEREVGSAKLGAVKDDPEFVLYYNYYKLKGSAGGDQVARMLHGVLSHPAAQKVPVRFYFDPLFKLGFGNMFGYFDPVRKVIGFGPEALLASSVGVAEIIRHEIHHYFEHVKLESGEMTLHRLVLADAKNPDASYPKLRGDEAGAHILDARARQASRINRIDRELSLLLLPEIHDRTRAIREGVGKESQKNLLSIVESLIKVNSELLVLADQGRWKPLERDESMDLDYAVFETPNSPYQTSAVILKGFATARSSPQEIREALLKILTWNKQRLEQLNREIQRNKRD